MISNEFLDKCRVRTDEEADMLVLELLQKYPKERLFSFMHCAVDNYSDMPTEVIRFVEKRYPSPDWIKPLLLRRANAFFYHHIEAIMTILGAYSLPYCYAGADGARLLIMSEKIRNNTEQRLRDTAQFVLQMCSKGAFDEDGEGWKAVQLIRLRHAIVRYGALKSGKWNMEWGAPVNMEDMAATNLSFSYIVLLGLQKLGHVVDQRSQESWLHLWALIGLTMKIDDSMLPLSMKDARELEKTIRVRQFRESEHGKALTSSLMSYFAERLKENNLSENWAKGFMHYLMGEELAGLIGIKPGTFSKKRAEWVISFQKVGNYFSVIPGGYEQVMRDL